jgi:hypothetical protein
MNAYQHSKNGWIVSFLYISTSSWWKIPMQYNGMGHLTGTNNIIIPSGLLPLIEDSEGRKAAAPQ